jgi:hypothetical protein
LPSNIESQVFTLQVHDTSEERKNADHLLAYLEDALKTLQNDWGVVAVAVVTDASGECRKAKRKLAEKYPALIVIDCYSHQVRLSSAARVLSECVLKINLVVGDYFKFAAEDVLVYTDKASELITWLRSKTLVLALLRTAQMNATGHAKAVIRAVITRWTAHFQAYRRLLELKSTLTSIVYADEARPDNQKLIVTGDAKAKSKSKAMTDVIKDPQFWVGIARYISFSVQLRLLS